MTDLDSDDREMFTNKWIQYIGLGNLGEGSKLRLEASDDLDELSMRQWWSKWRKQIPKHLRNEAKSALINLDA